MEEEQRNRTISETLTNLKPHQLDMIRTEEFKKMLQQQIPYLRFQVKQTEVNLCGKQDIVTRAKLYILDKVNCTDQDTFEISETKGKVFAKVEVKSYLVELLLRKGNYASWMCIDRSVTVFAFDARDLNEAVEVLKNGVVESRLPLSAVYLPRHFGKSYQWQQFIRKHIILRELILLIADLNDSFIIVAVIKFLIEKFKRKIEDFVFQTLHDSQNRSPSRYLIVKLWQ